MKLYPAVGALLCAAVVSSGAHAWADPYDDNPTPTQEVCGAFNLGVPPGQIPGMLERNDARYNYWRAVGSTVWPILEGGCTQSGPSEP